MATAEPTRAPDPTPAKPRVSKATLDVFFKIALVEQNNSGEPSVAKWVAPVAQVHLSGTVSGASRACAERTITDFNALSATTKLKLTDGAGDIALHIVPRSRFKAIYGGADADHEEFVHVDWDAGTSRVTGAVVLVSSTEIAATQRCYGLRRSLTAAMGLLKNTTGHPDSVLTDDPDSFPTHYSALDKQLIKLLYSDAIHPLDDRKIIGYEVTVA